jgi:hypothetical protein
MSADSNTGAGPRLCFRVDAECAALVLVAHCDTPRFTLEAVATAWKEASGDATLAARDARNHAKALAHRGEAPRLGDSELDSLVEDFGLVADGDVSLAASPGVEG